MKSVREHAGLPTSVRFRRPGRRGARLRRTAGADPSRAWLEHSGLLSFAGLTLGVFLSRRFFILPLAVLFTLAQETAVRRLAVVPRRR